MENKPIVFGPWVGEFAWELVRWNPACRAIASKSNAKKYAIGPTGHKVIYEFVDEYIDFDESFKYISNMNNCVPITPNDANLFKSYNEMASKLGEVVWPSLVAAGRTFDYMPKPYVGTRLDYISQIIRGKPLICVFPRQRRHQPQRNWPITNWVEIIKYYCDRGYHVMAFGGPEDNKLPLSHESFTDFVGYRKRDELDIAISALNKSVLCVAIQSGGISLGLYAASKTIAFGIPLYTNRVKAENFFNAQYEYVIVENFAFKPEIVISAVNRHLGA